MINTDFSGKGHWLRFFITGIIFLILTGCESDDNESASETTSQSSTGLLALFPQKIDGSGWNKAGYAGAEGLSKRLGLNFHYLETVQFSDEALFHQQVGEQILKNDIRIVMAHGGQYINAINRIATDYPRVNFVINSSCAGNNANVGCLSFNWRQLGLIAGVAAALKTDSQRIGFIGGMKLDVLEQLADGMEHSARHIRPGIEFKRIWLDSWTSERQALEAARDMIAGGVDVIAVNADPASKVIYPLLEQHDVAIVGRQLEQYERFPQTMLANVQLNTKRLIEFGFQQMLQGRWEGKLHQFGIYDQVQSITLADHQLTPAQRKIYESFYHDILSGTFERGQ
ncbi:BMP family ABC transporter substrate-binding protein [Oceanospirillum sediminis]|uniref:BMP family ABC transporter substrate-binding protein n=1 Tax=Oceanospirillum sediminis TaxID=2760088 RepID=A0A839ITU8_9GAMM|nr:BMP family ABC transporter substrate-binding protein [Oceanospirillum sediminis]MBB1487909.1 BMP family ABC transporter substrate-binding protein [Oceanospirillum sediminis]